MWAVVAQMVQCMGGTQGERRAGSWPPPLTMRVRVHVLDWLRIGGGGGHCQFVVGYALWVRVYVCVPVYSGRVPPQLLVSYTTYICSATPFSPTVVDLDIRFRSKKAPESGGFFLLLPSSSLAK